MQKVIFIFSVLYLFAFSVHAQSMICSYCGKQIERTYISYEGKPYHENCYRSFIQPRCANCGKPIDGRFIMKDGNKYHEKCYTQNVALKCSLCGEVINGTYSSDYWGNNYHSSHLNREAKCDYCDRYISGELTKGGSKYGDGRVICGLCERTSVNSLTKAKSIINSVKNSLQSLGVSINLYQLGVKLVNKDKLRSITLENGDLSDPRGFAKYSYWKTGSEITKREFTIFILSGMPQKEFEAVAAHELMHVWQYINASGNLEPRLAEGSAEYVSYLYMNKQRDEYSEYIVNKIETNTDPVYGGGFRRVKNIADQKGLNYLLSHLRISNKFPVGY